MLNKLRCHFQFSASQIAWSRFCYEFTYLMANSADPDQLASSVAQLDARLTVDQEVAGLTPAEVGNIRLWRLIMKYFLWSFSPFRWLKKGKFFRSQLIWIYTVYKGKAYLGSAGLGLMLCIKKSFVCFSQVSGKVLYSVKMIWYFYPLHTKYVGVILFWACP